MTSKRDVTMEERGQREGEQEGGCRHMKSSRRGKFTQWRTGRDYYIQCVIMDKRHAPRRQFPLKVFATDGMGLLFLSV